VLQLEDEPRGRGLGRPDEPQPEDTDGERETEGGDTGTERHRRQFPVPQSYLARAAVAAGDVGAVAARADAGLDGEDGHRHREQQ
jgi:hypothetical protein